MGNDLLMTISIILIAGCLRAPITGLGPILSVIRTDLSLSGGAAGLLTTIPVAVFGLTSIVAGWAGTRYGSGRVVMMGQISLLVGILIRSFGGSIGLFAGTVLIGVGISAGNVLLPVIIKQRMAEKLNVMTSAYTGAMNAVSGVASAISVPLAAILGWRCALSVWAFLVLAAIVAWKSAGHLKEPGFGERRYGTDKSLKRGYGTFKSVKSEHGLSESIKNDSGADESVKNSSESETGRIFNAGIPAVRIAVYMGVQSLLFYSFAAWLATIVQSHGYSSNVSGGFNSVYMMATIVGSFTIPLLIKGRKEIAPIGVMLGIMYMSGMAFMLLAYIKPELKMVFLIPGILICGFCAGGCLSYAVSLFTFHTRTTAQASTLSGFSQSVGYLIAALGPFFSGRIYDIAGRWDVVLATLLVITIVLISLALSIKKRGIIIGSRENA